jgi:hypothetical protein
LFGKSLEAKAKGMKPLPPPDIAGRTEAEKFDNALRRVFSVSKDDLLKRGSREKIPAASEAHK